MLGGTGNSGEDNRGIYLPFGNNFENDIRTSKTNFLLFIVKSLSCCKVWTIGEKGRKLIWLYWQNNIASMQNPLGKVVESAWTNHSCRGKNAILSDSRSLCPTTMSNICAQLVHAAPNADTTLGVGKTELNRVRRVMQPSLIMALNTTATKSLRSRFQFLCIFRETAAFTIWCQ